MFLSVFVVRAKTIPAAAILVPNLFIQWKSVFLQKRLFYDKNEIFFEYLIILRIPP